MSVQIQKLEDELGERLFERTKRKVRLTPHGAHFLERALRVLAEVDGLRERLQARVDGERGSLRVGMIDAASLYVLPEVIRDYRDAHPRVELRLRVDTSAALVAALPKTAVGKTDKKVIRARYWADAERAVN